MGLNALCYQLHLLSVLFCDVLRAFSKRLDASHFGILVPRKRGRSGARVGAASAHSDGGTTATTRSTCSLLAEEAAPVVDRGAAWVRPARPAGDGPRVHCFHAAEVRALYLACETQLERLLLSCLFTTGMRIGGLCLLRRPEGASSTATISDAVVGLRTLEKGNHYKDYPLAPGVRALLPAWLADEVAGAGTHYLFPSRAGGQPAGERPWSTRDARRAFMLVAARAGLSGSHVKPHTTRHTVAWTLSALGNRLEDVADFVGHKSPSITKEVYIAMEAAHQRARMTCPWLEDDPTAPGGGDAKARLQALALELASALAGPFTSLDGRTFPCYSPRSTRAGSEVAPRPAIVKRVRLALDVPEHVAPTRIPIDEAEHTRVTAQSLARAEAKAERREAFRRSMQHADETNARVIELMMQVQKKLNKNQ